MAGIFSKKNWSNLLFGFRGKGDGKGAPGGGAGGATTVSWEGDGSPNLPYWDISNRVKILSKDYEQRKEGERKQADKETRVKEMREELQAMGFTVSGSATRRRKNDAADTGKGTRKPGKGTTPALGAATSDDDDDDSGAITEISEKEAFLSCKTAEKIAASYGCNIRCGEEPLAPISLTDVAALVVNDRGFSRSKLMKSRQDLYGMKASSAGSKMTDEALVASLLAGHLGKMSQKL